MSLVSSAKEVWAQGPGPTNKKEYIIHFLKGFLMGTADLIPGVSGGTMAFITGIYEGLLAAIASIDGEVLKLLLKFQIKEVLKRVHLRFIIPLGFGILMAIFSLARLMNFLIREKPIPTWALFFGLILASIIVIWRQLEDHFHIKNLIFIALGALFAWLIIGLIPVETPDGHWFLYLCGVISITAMILPGISGSFLLLILGKYEYITAAVKNPFSSENIVIMGVFAAGAATSLIGFSKLLNWLLTKFHGPTMAFLTGVLIGSMRKVWPWKEVLETKVIRGKTKILREANILPQEFNNEFYLAVVLVVLGFAAVMAMDIYSRKKKIAQSA